MKFESFGHGYACQHHVVELEGDEIHWPDGRIITACDRHGVCTDEDWAEIVDGRHPGHFGGRIERYSTTRMKVTVYID